MGMISYISAILAMDHSDDHIVVSFDTSCPLPRRSPSWNSCRPQKSECPPKSSIFNDTITGLCNKTQNPYADVFRRIVTRIDEVTVSMNDSLKEFVENLKE